MKRPLIFTLLFMTICGIAFGLGAKPVPAADTTFINREMVIVRAYFDDPAMVSLVAKVREPWEVHYDKGYLVVEATPKEYQQMSDWGFRLEIDEAKTAFYFDERQPLPDQLSGIPGFSCYRTVEETYATAQNIATQHPQLATWTDVGDSWDKINGFGGYDMMVLTLTNSAIPGPKPQLFITSSIHAREYTPAELVTRFAEYLIDNYDTNADARWLIDSHEIHLMFQANPDGRKKAETGLSWRKNTNQAYCGATSNSRGADLNRNFSFQWGCCGGSSTNACDLTYRGASAGSEPEVQTIQNYILTHYPDQRDDPPTSPAPADATGVYLDIHSYSELVLWPWGYTNQTSGNNTAFQTLGRKFAYFNNYTPEQAIDLYITDGTTDDYAYGKMGVAAFTFELGTDFFQSCGVFENTILPDNMQALIYAAKVARTPFLTAAGPDALSVAVSANPVSVGDTFNLTASANDTHYNNSNGTEPTQAIAAAEYYVDVPPWGTSPVAHAMTAVDGTFNSSIEAVQASVNTTGWTQGEHMLYVRSKDSANNWGAVSAIFVYVVDPAVAPVINGDVTAADTGLPLAATVNANNLFQATTDGNGHYEMLVISDTYQLTAVPTDPNYAPATVSNIVADNGQTVTQNFVLYPYCNAYSDNVEAGTNGWTAQVPWAITTEKSHTPTHSWTDSPNGPYGDNRNITLTSPAINLTGYNGSKLEFWHICDTEAGYDYCTVEISPDGTNWNAVASYDGAHNTWTQVSLDISALDNQPNARIRFHFTSDGGVTADGWHVDDVVVRGAGPACTPIIAPTANFTSSSPDELGTATTFTDGSVGGDLTYTWDFGDSSPTSNLPNPSHTYANTGTFTVTLTVSNSVDSDSITHPVDILLAPRASFTANSPVLVATAVAFNNTSTGDNLTYTWDFGDGNTSSATNPNHTFAVAGTYTVSLTATNDVGSSTTTSDIVVLDAPVAEFTSTSPDSLGSITVFTDASTGGDLSYGWDLGDGATSTAANPSHTYPAIGTYTVTLTVSNTFGSDSVAHLVEIIAAPTASFTSTSPTALGSATVFTNTSGGADLSFTWNLGDGTVLTATNVSHTYAQTGTYTVTLTAVNDFGSDVYTDVVGVWLAPQASFTATTPVELGSSTIFSNTSTGDYLHYLWAFGDGMTSTLASPVHLYAASGTYSVTLTVSNEVGSSTATQDVLVVQTSYELFLPVARRQ